VREQIGKLTVLLITLGIIFGIFWGLKRQNWVSIPQMETAMEPEYPPGTYHVGVAPDSMDDVVLNKAYAFIVPGSPEREKRVAWMVAKEGQTVEFKDKAVHVNGVKTDCTVNIGKRTMAPFIVPRGCVYMLSTMPEKDSLKFGPIPLRNVAGQL
jgi:hypothetical protein